MIITIDTAKDSKDEMRKAAQLLLALSDGNPIVSPTPSVANIFSSSSSQSTPALTITSTPTPQQPAPAFSGFASMFDDTLPTAPAPSVSASAGVSSSPSASMQSSSQATAPVADVKKRAQFFLQPY